MPLYEFGCPECGGRTSVFLPVACRDSSNPLCGSCIDEEGDKYRMLRVRSATPFQIEGKGYINYKPGSV